MILEHILGNRHAKLRVHITHKHRRLTECLAHPLCKTAFLSLAGIMNPEGIRNSAIVGRTEQSAVRSGCKSRLHFCLCLNEMLAVIVILIVDRLQACE